MSFGGGQIIEKWGYTNLFALGMTLYPCRCHHHVGDVEEAHADGCSPGHGAITYPAFEQAGSWPDPTPSSALGEGQIEQRRQSLACLYNAIIRTVSMLSVITVRS